MSFTDLLSTARLVEAGERRALPLFFLSPQDKLVEREETLKTSPKEEGAKKKTKITKKRKKKKEKTEEEHDPSSILHDLSSCGLNTVFTPSDLVCIYTSFASLGGGEFQQLLRSIGDVLSLHIPHLPFTTDVSLLYSCSQLNFYPRNLINSLLFYLPAKLSADLERNREVEKERKSHQDQEKTLEKGRENQQAFGVHAPLEAPNHRDNHERACLEKDYFLEGNPSKNKSLLLHSSLTSSACLSAPLAERSGTRVRSSLLLKALARLNSRHKPTLAIALEGLKSHRRVLDDALRNKDPKEAKTGAHSSSSSSSSPSTRSFSPCLSSCSSESSRATPQVCNAPPASFFFWRSSEVEDAVSVLYSLYRLDVWHEETIHSSLEVVSRLDGPGRFIEEAVLFTGSRKESSSLHGSGLATFPRVSVGKRQGRDFACLRDGCTRRQRGEREVEKEKETQRERETGGEKKRKRKRRDPRFVFSLSYVQ